MSSKKQAEGGNGKEVLDRVRAWQSALTTAQHLARDLQSIADRSSNEEEKEAAVDFLENVGVMILLITIRVDKLTGGDMEYLGDDQELRALFGGIGGEG